MQFKQHVKIEATSYDPWGQVLSGGTSSRFLYTGKEKDAETGLSYYESRYYNPDIQHFIQPDTWLPNIYDPQQLNRYAYANNNPLRYTDPTGHFSIQSAWNSVVSFFTGGNSKKESPPPVSTKEVQKMFGTSEVKLNNNSSSGSTNNSGGGSTFTGASAVGGAVVSLTNSYSVYVGEQQGSIKYTGITKQPIQARFNQHLSSSDPLRSTLKYRELYSNLSKITARGSEQAYIEAYKLIKNGANKINSISPKNPIYQQAKDAAYAASAVPAVVAGMSATDVMGALAKPFFILDYNSAASAVAEDQSY